MNSPGQSRYQVYFFLYLAVICEMLIIIVERDDAEREYELERARLINLSKRAIHELVNSLPTANSTGSTMMKVGEIREFSFVVSGLNTGNDVTVGPYVHILRGNDTVMRYSYPSTIRDSVMRDEHGRRTFAFTFRAPAPGRYRIEGQTGTDFIDVVRTDSIKIGHMMIARKDFERITDRSVDDYLKLSENIASSMTVDVISDLDPLFVRVPNVETAVGYETNVPVYVSGTTFDKVRAVSSVGTVSARDGGLIWTGSFSEAGDYTVTVDAGDNRGAGTRSFARTSFKVTVRDASAGRIPVSVYTNETFRFNVAVAGLPRVTFYRWRIMQGDRELSSGEGPVVEYKPVETGRLSVHATYDGKPYAVKGGGVSVFPLTVEPTPYRIDERSFTNGGEYPVSHKFEVEISRYGRRPREYSMPVQPAEIRVDAEDENGRNLLDGLDVRVTSDRTIAVFYLRGKVPRDGMIASVRVSAGPVTQRYKITLHGEEGVKK